MHDKNNMHSRLSPQWLPSNPGNSCTWTNDVWLNIAGTSEPKRSQ